MFRADMHTENDGDASPTKRPRKARQRKEHVTPKPSDFAPRVSSAWKVGAHVSAAGGVENSIVNAARVRCVSRLPCFAPVVMVGCAVTGPMRLLYSSNRNASGHRPL